MSFAEEFKNGRLMHPENIREQSDTFLVFIDGSIVVRTETLQKLYPSRWTAFPSDKEIDLNLLKREEQKK
ncbi:MAG: hypothetical protein WCW78_03615 [Candidatus Paceibacterota bacterium]|jgi:hypothetical protein